MCLDPEMNNNTRRINFGNLVDRSLRDINDRILFAIENQVDPNIQSITTKKTALHFMAESGNLEAVRMLLKSGADSILIDANNLFSLIFFIL